MTKTKTKTAHIDCIQDSNGTHWDRPYRLWAPGLSGWICLGTFETEAQARSAARRKGYTVPAAPRQRATARQVRAMNRAEVL